MDRYYGVKLYDRAYCNGRNLDLMEECGFNTVFLGRGALDKAFTEELTRRGFFWNIVEPVFLLQPDEPYALATLGDGKPAHDDWVRFACPTDGEHLDSVRRRITDDIRTYDPPGVSLDFIRFFQFWETTGPHAMARELPQSCFCPRCTEQQKAFPTLGEWRRKLIGKTAADLCATARGEKRTVRIGIHCVPWTRNLFDGAIMDVIGQNFRVLSETGDYLTPMIYHHMMRMEPSYVGELLRDMESQGCAHVLPSIQVRQAYRTDEMGADEFGKALELSLEGRSEGVVLYKWEDLAGDECRIDIVKNTLKR